MNSIINFSDVFKNKFLEGFHSQLTNAEILLSISVVFILSLGIMFLYKITVKSVMYSKSFNIAMACMSLVTAIVIMAVRSNVVLSLGMVGALSIVRFRTAIKEPMDLLFLFWSISIGIVAGAGNYFLAILGSLAVAGALIVYSCIPSASNPYLLVINCNNDDTIKAILNEMKKYTKKYKIKSESFQSDNIEITIELNIKEMQGEFVGQMSKIAGVKTAVLITYDGEYIS